MSDSFCSFLSATPNSTHNSHAAPKITTISSIAQPFCICNHLLTFNHHVGHAAEEGTSNKGSNVQPQQSSRWSPTAVQLLLLEELYRQGMKTPSAEQIQQIASQLRQFGKIEGKNVFYWFQNHKARERQKRRRREMEETAASSTQGLKETGCGVKETKKWASTSNCSEHAEESAAALDIAEKGSTSSTGWAQFEEREDIQVLRKKIAAERNAKCQNIMEMPPCCFPPNFAMPTTTSVSVAAYRTIATRNNTQLLTPPQNYVLNRESFNYYEVVEEENADPPRTLDLFPLKRDGQSDICLAQRKSMETDQIASSEQFFEFLPLRN